MERREIVVQLKTMRAAQRDISFSGLRAAGRGALLGAAIKTFGTYRNAVEAAGIDYFSVARTRPKGHWNSMVNIRREVEALARRLRKPCVALTTGDLNANGLGGVLHKFGDVPMRLYRAIGFSARELRGRRNSKGYWRFRENRIRAVREVLRKAGRRYEDSGAGDFRRHGFGGLVDYALTTRRWSLFRLFKEAGFKGQPWQLKRVGNVWASRRERLRAIRWLVAKSKKNHHDVTQKDFRRQGLAGMMVTCYADSPFQALRDAGFKIDPLRFPLLPDGYWDSPRNQKAAMRRLMELTGKRRLEEITTDDIYAAGLNTLYKKHRSIVKLLQAVAGPRFDASQLQPGRFRHRSNHGHWFRSDGERQLDDLLHERFGFKEHKHDFRYPGSRKNCDFVTDDKRLWIEYAGMISPHPRGSRMTLEEKYRRNLRAKGRIARKHGLELVIVYPRDLRSKNGVERKLRKILEPSRVDSSEPLPVEMANDKIRKSRFAGRLETRRKSLKGGSRANAPLGRVQ